MTDIRLVESADTVDVDRFDPGLAILCVKRTFLR